MNVESKPQCAGSPFQSQQEAVQGDVWMTGRLFCLRSEKGDGGFFSKYS